MQSRFMIFRPTLCVATLGAVILGLIAVLPLRDTHAFPLNGNDTTLPAGSELNEEALERPRELFHTEAFGGKKSYLVNLGDVAFHSPGILGGAARQAAISCGSCHVNGAGNGKLFIPGLSTRPGTFDTTSLLFNPKTYDAQLNPVRIPSLRGARFLTPYGNDGRIGSLREFARNVIVNEFAGPEPSPAILDAIVAYLNDIDFLPNPRIGAGGRLAAQASVSERRGETLFFKPFRKQANLSCAGCHVPTGAFVDHAQHDVGTGGLFKTPTLLNANFNAPYFHDGRYGSYDEVVEHFDRIFDLGYSEQDKKDLVAYLTAVGDADRPFERDNVALRMKEVDDFSSILLLAIPARDAQVVSMVATTVGAELRELAERIPDHKNTSVEGGLEERRAARNAVKELVLNLRRIEIAAAAGDFDKASAEYESFSKQTFIVVPSLLKKAQAWTLFNAGVSNAHYGAMRQMLQSSNGQSR
jgi:cytochrome c peroxidase